jgi:hypothetical protein
MKRPRYENPRTRATEDRVIRYLNERHGYDVMRTPDFYELDLFMRRREDGAYAYGEVKGRSCARLESPFYIMSQHKWVAGLRYAGTFGIPVFVFFLFSDHELGYINIPIMHREAPPEIFWHGRTDRGDAQDMEPCVKIPNTAIKPITTLEPTP